MRVTSPRFQPLRFVAERRMSLARPFKAGITRQQKPVVASATIEWRTPDGEHLHVASLPHHFFNKESSAMAHSGH